MTDVRLHGGRYDGATIEFDADVGSSMIGLCVWPLEGAEAVEDPKSSMDGTRVTFFDDLGKIPMFEGTYLRGPNGEWYRPSILPGV